MPDYPLGVLIKHIQIQIGKSLNHRLEQMNITGSQAHVLVFLMNRTSQRTTLRDLEEHSDVKSCSFDLCLRSTLYFCNFIMLSGNASYDFRFQLFCRCCA